MELLSSIRIRMLLSSAGDYPGHIKLVSRGQQSSHPLMPWKEVRYERMLHVSQVSHPYPVSRTPFMAALVLSGGEGVDT